MSRPRAALAIRSGLAALLASALAAGCDRPFDPLQENLNGPFSMIGYLDLGADTQWVRVMPVRQSLLSAPEPIDAAVTLEHLGTGRTVSLRDSVFRYADARLGTDAYAHLYWTTERLEPKERYRLRATRSDGEASSAVVEMPEELQFTYSNLRDTAHVELQAHRLLFVETIHAMRTPTGEPGGSAARRQLRNPPSGDPPRHIVSVDGAPLFRMGLVDVRRIEMRIVVAHSTWPSETAPPDVVAGSAADTMPSNVENGVGFVGGVATRTIPFNSCEVVTPRPDSRFSPCRFTHDRQATSVSGRVIRSQCGRPHRLGEVRLRATFPDGGVAVLRWRSGWEGEYRFEGVEPGSELALQAFPGAPLVPLPRLGPGQHHVAPDLFVPDDC